MSAEFHDILSPIFGRRSVRAYQDRDIDDTLIEAMLQAAMAAPSAVHKDPWRFIVVKNRKTLIQISACLPNGAMLASAGVGFIVCGDISAAHGNELSYLLQDCSAAIENLLLAAHMLGLGGCWLGVHPRDERVRHLREMFALEESIIPVACVSVGYPAENPPPRTRYNEQYVHHEKW